MSPKNKVSANYQKYITRFNLANEINANLLRITLPTFISLITVGMISPVVSEIEACDYATEQDQYYDQVSSFEGIN